MKVNLTYNFTTNKFIIVENNLLYEIPFSVIFDRGRKLIYYSNNNSDTKVRDWYEELEENYKLQISISEV